MDFTFKTYKTLLNALIQQGFVFQTFQEFIESYKGLASPSGDTGASAEEDKQKTIILPPACAIASAGRHDVDKLPENYSQAREISRLFYTGFD